jgi:hypothetical protein
VKPPAITIDGSVSAVTAYSLSQLRAMSTAFGVSEPGRNGARQVTEVGVPLESLVTPTVSYPPFANAKNMLLRVTLTVRGKGGREVTFALGELDPNFGNRPAPADRRRRRQVLLAAHR